MRWTRAVLALLATAVGLLVPASTAAAAGKPWKACPGVNFHTQYGEATSHVKVKRIDCATAKRVELKLWHHSGAQATTYAGWTCHTFAIRAPGNGLACRASGGRRLSYWITGS